MNDIRRVTETFAVAPQIEPDDLAAVKAAGFTLVINNRPDGETPGQPNSATMAEAARTADLAYSHMPVRGMPTAAQIEAMATAIEGATGPVLAFCRSGTRSITLWALSQVEREGRSRDALLQAAGDAGYDLSQVLG